MNVIRETVRVVKEEIEKDPANYDKYYSSKQAASSAEKKGIGQTTISEYLGGPWKRVNEDGKKGKPISDNGKGEGHVGTLIRSIRLDTLA